MSTRGKGFRLRISDCGFRLQSAKTVFNPQSEILGGVMIQKGLRLHSIAGLLKERTFVGSFEAGGAKHGFSYLPMKATVAGQKLLLEGRLTVVNPRGNARVRERVQALLAS